MKQTEAAFKTKKLGYEFMGSQIVAKTNIVGLHWETNNYEYDGDLCLFIVSSSSDSEMVDLVTHDAGFKYGHYGIHVGQIDRLTFFGSPDQVIVGRFVDCRRDSPTLHKTECFKFNPNPKRKLIIERGIAHTFENLGHVVTRDEPIWYVAEKNPDYNLANDVINFPLNSKESEYPVVTPNNLPIPAQCYQFTLARQQETFRTTVPSYPTRLKVNLDGIERYVVVTPHIKHSKVPSSSVEATLVPGVEWRSTCYAASGTESYYLVNNPDTNFMQMLHFDTSIPSDDYSIQLLHRGILTFFGIPEKHIQATLIDCRSNSPVYHRIITLNFRPDPTRCLHIPVGVAYHFSKLECITIRAEDITLLSSSNKEQEQKTLMNIPSKTPIEEFPTFESVF
jgi:dTDP-4-dehydrorhamnose 3,5-epimerase-like enzyme